MGEERGLIGNEAVKYFFEEMDKHYYEYVRLGETVSKLRAEKVRLTAEDITNSFMNMFLSSMSSGKSSSKDKPNGNAVGSDKRMNPVDNSNTTEVSDDESGPPSTFVTYSKMQKRDHSFEISNEGQIEKSKHASRKLPSKLEVQPHPASERQSTRMKFKSDRLVPQVSQDHKNRLQLPPRPPRLPKSHQSEGISHSNSQSSRNVLNIKSDPGLVENDEDWLQNKAQIEEGITKTIMKSMFGDRDEDW